MGVGLLGRGVGEDGLFSSDCVQLLTGVRSEVSNWGRKEGWRKWEL